MKKILLSIVLALNVWAINVGEIPKSISIDGKNGGLVTGGAWKSSQIKDKVYVMFYVDPDEKDTNEHFVQALKAKKYDRSRFGTIAVINLGATWKPNFIIEKLLKSKQEEFPHTIYAKDKEKVLVDAWDLENDASDVLLFSKDGTLLFYKSGKMQDADMSQVYSLIESHL